jgi:hypothetical protein
LTFGRFTERRLFATPATVKLCESPSKAGGLPFHLQLEKREGGVRTQAIVECQDKRITTTEGEQILARQKLAQQKLPRHGWTVVSSEG